MRPPFFRIAAAAFAALGAWSLLAQNAPDAPAKPEQLGGAGRSLTHLSTDKPIYRPGETLYARGLMLDAATRRPHMPSQDESPSAYVKIVSPKGETLMSGYAAPQESIIPISWQLPSDLAGGTYTLRVEHPMTGDAPTERSFEVRAYRPPRIKTQITFARDGYGPGDTVSASLAATRAEGGAPVGATVTTIARVDGEEVFRRAGKIDGLGGCVTEFALPSTIERGEGVLVMVIEDGGVVETASKTIPILLQTVDLNLFPEGGDLVAGLATRVYFEARTPNDKPADISGVVLNDRGDTVASFRSEHEGRGRISFTPRRGETYAMRIDEPAGITRTFPLPEVKPTGASLRAAADRYSAGAPITLRVGVAGVTGQCRVTLSRHAEELASTNVLARDGAFSEVSLTPPAFAAGALTATVWSEQGQPLAERLIFVEPDRSLKIALTPDKSRYTPGEPVNVGVRVTDERGQPVSAWVGLTVFDDSVMEMLETREQPPRLPAMALLESDVRELFDAHVYLDRGEEKADIALDLLLGTQGWRRFALMNVDEFVEKFGDAGRRALAKREVVTRYATRGAGANERKFTVMLARPVPSTAAVDKAEGDLVQALGGEMEDEEQIAEAAAPNPAPPPAEEAPRDANMRQNEVVAQGRAGQKQELAKRIAREDRRDGLVGLGYMHGDDDFDARYAPAQLLVVREYAHTTRPGRRPNDRADFTETLFWNVGVKTDASGMATVKFDTSDAVTSFRVVADAHDENGALGATHSLIESVEPFYIEPKAPLFVTAGDVVRLPVALVNGLDRPMQNVLAKVEISGDIEVSTNQPISLAAGGRARQIIDMIIGDAVGEREYMVLATDGQYKDRVTRTLNIEAAGFPSEIALGGLLERDSAVLRDFEIPADVVRNSVSAEIVVYPTPLANMTSALAALIREPYGCFEQTSSSTYPLVMAQQYFLTHSGVDPQLIERSRGLLDKGYERLTGYECKSGGYEWFGADPGHEALTAFGLMEFMDMGQVRAVDTAMLSRTRDWLMNQRDGSGGFKRERRALHTWIADKDCSDAYILWALTRAGVTGLSAEIASLKERALASDNSYVVALAANVFGMIGDASTATRLNDRLAQKQSRDGFVDGATQSIVGSGGDALRIETTALAVQSWLRDPSYAGAVEQAVRYLAETCKSGRYGSTQSTVLALQAIVQYDEARAADRAAGAVQLFVDGAPVGEAVAFEPTAKEPIKLANVSELLSTGKHTIELRMNDGSRMPYAVSVRFNRTLPETSDECKLLLDVKLRDTTLADGEVTEIVATIRSKADEPLPTPIAIIGVPGGLEPRHDQLKELVKAGKIAAYETRGRDVVLYWRSFTPGQKVEIPISLIAAVPGDYTGPASRTYQYYTDEFKTWAPGVSVRITPR